VPQEPVLLDYLSVFDNVLLPLSIDGATDLDRSTGQRLSHDLGIEKHADDRPRALNGGEKTRVSLARALVSKPSYLFLDEPFVELDLMRGGGIYSVL
jgi:ABC-type nitrate/sulfonate/bicarbonate transport system ATPase subunit